MQHDLWRDVAVRVEHIGDVKAADAEHVRERPHVPEVDRGRHNGEAAQRGVRMVRGVQQGQVAAEAVAEQADLVAAGQPQQPGDPGRQVFVDVILEPVLRVAFVGNAPIEQPHIEARLEQPLDEAVAGGKVEDVAVADQGEHDEQWRSDPDVVVAVVPQLGSAATPCDVLGCAADGGAGGGQADPVTGAEGIALSRRRRTRSSTR